MIKTNYHMHTKFCDGKSTAEEYVLKAIEKNMSAIGITAHSPVPFESYFNMSEQNFKIYLKEMDYLKEKYANDIQIYTGLEVDYTNKKNLDLIEIFKEKIDYKIGSVHFIFDETTNTYYNIDGDFETFKNTLNLVSQGKTKDLVTKYYKELIRIIKFFKFDILGHLDIIKKQNNNNLFFDENESWYKYIINEVLNIIKASGIIVEVNTGGIIRGYINETYPSNWIIKECFKKDIPIVLNSDAHHADHLNLYLEEAVEKVKSLGCKKQRILLDNTWKDCKI